MKESVLKKQFKSRDLQRIRNLINKDYNGQVGSQVGYTTKYNKHKEGDIWVELGKQWTIKNGVKINITKLSTAKNLGLIPLLCPKCSNPISTEIDKKVYKLFSNCLGCQLKYETDLKIEGKFEEYESNIMKCNVRGFIQSTRSNIDDLINDIKSETIVSESGDIEDWEGNNEYLDKIKTQIIDELVQLEEKFLH